jgi:hypothetical protein
MDLSQSSSNIVLRPSQERGFFDHGWLQTYHTFSFDQYHDPAYTRFRTLRVINQDRVQPNTGFPTHAHQNMEIITYVLQGAVTHQDTLGNETVIRAGEIQCMSAGTGVMHSEHNRSHDEWLELLQIWIFPQKAGLTPGYQQQAYDRDAQGLQLLAAPAGAGGLVTIHQDAKLLRANLVAEQTLEYAIAPQRALWLQMIRGTLTLGDQQLTAGDGAGISRLDHIALKTTTACEFLLFDLG